MLIDLKTLKAIDWKTFNILDVITGCGEGYLADYLDRGEKYKEVVKYRLKICAGCPIYNDGSCDPNQTLRHVSTGLLVPGCGCNIRCKTALKSSSCPAGKWMNID